jgi:hypothetical protein
MTFSNLRMFPLSANFYGSALSLPAPYRLKNQNQTEGVNFENGLYPICSTFGLLFWRLQVQFFENLTVFGPFSEGLEIYPHFSSVLL